MTVLNSFTIAYHSILGVVNIIVFPNVIPNVINIITSFFFALL